MRCEPDFYIPEDNDLTGLTMKELTEDEGDMFLRIICS
jgi:hypothetical protein